MLNQVYRCSWSGRLVGERVRKQLFYESTEISALSSGFTFTVEQVWLHLYLTHVFYYSGKFTKENYGDANTSVAFGEREGEWQASERIFPLRHTWPQSQKYATVKNSRATACAIKIDGTWPALLPREDLIIVFPAPGTLMWVFVTTQWPRPG